MEVYFLIKSTEINVFISVTYNIFWQLLFITTMISFKSGR